MIQWLAEHLEVLQLVECLDLWHLVVVDLELWDLVQWAHPQELSILLLECLVVI